jgi:hypothetical protein
LNRSTYVKKISDKEEKETREQGSFELAHSFGPTILVQVDECFNNRGIGLGHQSLHYTCHTVGQADLQAGMQQPASYQELYASMPNVVLNGECTAYLAPFGPESEDQPATLWDRIFSAANDITKAFVMLLADPTPQIVFVHRPTRFSSSLLGVQPCGESGRMARYPICALHPRHGPGAGAYGRFLDDSHWC